MYGNVKRGQCRSPKEKITWTERGPSYKRGGSSLPPKKPHGLRTNRGFRRLTQKVSRRTKAKKLKHKSDAGLGDKGRSKDCEKSKPRNAGNLKRWAKKLWPSKLAREQNPGRKKKEITGLRPWDDPDVYICMPSIKIRLLQNLRSSEKKKGELWETTQGAIGGNKGSCRLLDFVNRKKEKHHAGHILCGRK